VAEEASECRDEQLDQALAGVRIAALRRSEPRIEFLVHGEPPPSSLQQPPMTIKQLDAGQTQHQASRSLELSARQG